MNTAGTLFRLERGYGALAWTQRGVTALVFPRTQDHDALRVLRERVGAWREEAIPSLWATELAAYFSGGKEEIELPADLEELSPFTRRVLAEVNLIPAGQTRTYGEMATILGIPRGSRAVGGALSRNPVPGIIPCHRVVGVNGIGGFGEGLEWKKYLLGREGLS